MVLYLAQLSLSIFPLQDELVSKEQRGVNWALMQQHPYIMGFCLVVVSVLHPIVILSQ